MLEQVPIEYILNLIISNDIVQNKRKVFPKRENTYELIFKLNSKYYKVYYQQFLGDYKFYYKYDWYKNTKHMQNSISVNSSYTGFYSAECLVIPEMDLIMKNIIDIPVDNNISYNSAI